MKQVCIMGLFGLPQWLSSKESTCDAEDAGGLGLIPGSGRSPGGGHGNHSSIVAWVIPWTEEPGGLQPIGSQRVRHDWSALACTHLSTYQTGHIYSHVHSRNLAHLHNTTPQLDSVSLNSYVGNQQMKIITWHKWLSAKGCLILWINLTDKPY